MACWNERNLVRARIHAHLTNLLLHRLKKGRHHRRHSAANNNHIGFQIDDVAKPYREQRDSFEQYLVRDNADHEPVARRGLFIPCFLFDTSPG